MNTNTSTNKNLPLYLIQRDVPKIGGMTPAELRELAQKSCGVLAEMSAAIEWEQSYVTADHCFCVYGAASEELIREHADKCGIPVNAILPVATIIGPFTAA